MAWQPTLPRCVRCRHEPLVDGVKLERNFASDTVFITAWHHGQEETQAISCDVVEADTKGWQAQLRFFAPAALPGHEKLAAAIARQTKT